LIYGKEVLCLVLTIYAVKTMYTDRVRLRFSLIVLAIFTLWCVFTGLMTLGGHGDLQSAGRWIRDSCAPLEFVLIGAALAKKPSIRSFPRMYVFTLGVLAIVAVCLIGSWGEMVWARYANVATFDIAVKGESSSEQDLTTGTNGSGNMSERSAFFGALAKYRAMGTFGEPISMAFNMAFGLLVAMFVVRKSSRWFLLLLALALLLSFTRSAWIFFTLASLFVLFKRRKVIRLAAFLAVIAGSLTLVAPLREFVTYSVTNLQGTGEKHSAGIKSFYSGVWARQESVWWGGSIVGSAVDEWGQQSLLIGDVNATRMPESGYGFLVMKNGIPAYILFLIFCVAGLVDLQQSPDKNLGAVMQGVILAVLVVMHTSYYVFAFSASIVIWIMLGATIAGYDPTSAFNKQ